MLNTLPFLFLGLPFGALIDSMNLKRVLNFADVIRAISYMALAIFFFCTKNSLLLIIAIYVLTGITACVNVINNIAETTFIPEIVENNEFSKMNSIIFGMQYIAGLIVPLIGGYIYSYDIVPYIFIGNATTFLISAAMIYNIHYSYSKKKESFSLSSKVKTLSSDLMDGIKYVKQNSSVGLTLFAVSISNFLTSNFENDVLVFFKIDKAFSSASIGRFLMVSFFGALVGSLICTKLFNKYSFKKLLLSNFFFHIVFRMMFILFDLNISYVLSLFMIYLLSSILNILVISNRQKVVERKYLGRVNSIYKTVLIGMNSLGYLYGGFVTNLIGVKDSMILSTILLALFSIIISPFIISNIKEN